MPDNFNIKVTTTADTSGIKQTQAELDALNAKAKSTAVAGGPVPYDVAKLEAANAAQEAQNVALTRTAAIESEIATIRQTKLDLVEADIAGNEADVAVLEDELKVRTATLGLLRDKTLSEAEIVALTENEARLLALINTETTAAAGATTEMASASVLAGASFGKARGEAVVLARELATGGNYIRTMGSLLGALGVPISIAATAAFVLYTHFKKTSEEAATLAREVGDLTAHLNKQLASYREITSVKEYENKLGEVQANLDKLHEDRATAKNQAEKDSIDAKIRFAEVELSGLNAAGEKTLERAATEERLKTSLKEQTAEIERADATFEQSSERARKNLETQKTLRQDILNLQLLAIEQQVRSGALSESGGIAAKYQAEASSLRDNEAATQRISDIEINNINQRDAASRLRLDSDKQTLDSRSEEYNKVALIKGQVEAAAERQKKANDDNADAQRASQDAAQALATAYATLGVVGLPSAAQEALAFRERQALDAANARAAQTKQTADDAARNADEVRSDNADQLDSYDQIKDAYDTIKNSVEADEKSREKSLAAVQKEIPALQQAAAASKLLADAAEAEARARASAALEEQQFAAFKAAGLSPAKATAEQQQKDFEAQNSATRFQAAQRDLQDRISRGGYGQSKAELEALGTLGEQGGVAPPSGPAQVQGAPYQPQISDTGNAGQRAATIRDEAARQAAQGGDKLSTAADKLSAAADKSKPDATPPWATQLVNVLTRLEQSFQ